MLIIILIRILITIILIVIDLNVDNAFNPLSYKSPRCLT